ncbi:MAG: hypothetical protein ACRC0L_05585 [Angustibacter sp.]
MTMSFEGGLPDVNGVIRTRSRLGADGDQSIAPGRWQGRIFISGGGAGGADHVGIPEQLFLRTAVYANGYLVLATPWQERSSLEFDAADGGTQVAFLAAAAAGLADPCLQLFPTGTHTQGSSLNDQQLACEAGRLTRASWIRTFTTIATTYGRPTLTQAVSAAAREVGLPDTAPPPTTTADHDEPDYLTTVATLLRRTRITGYGYPTQEDAPSQAAARASHPLDRRLHPQLGRAQ